MGIFEHEPHESPPFPTPLVSILQKTEIINTLMTHTDCNNIFIFESYVIGYSIKIHADIIKCHKTMTFLCQHYCMQMMSTGKVVLAEKANIAIHHLKKSRHHI